MFKKKVPLRSSRSSHVEKSSLDDAFWYWYYDSYQKIEVTVGDPIPYNPKKYHHNSKEVNTIRKYFEEKKFQVPADYEIMALLKSPFTQGDITKTCFLIRFFQLSSQGLFLTNKDCDRFGNKIKIVGAENWGNVMCYFDTLMFAMFANLESFEPILFISNQHETYLVSQLSTLLRLYVSLLRSGNLITTDITIRICEILSKLGFKEAMSNRQQDASVLFEFLTETLSMPLLTFKIDIKHGGKYNKDDDLKYSKERILFVSIPDEEEEQENGQENKQENGKEQDYEKISKIEHEESDDHSTEENVIMLEECLEHYFNNSINVKRELERRATLQSIKRDIPGGEASYSLPKDTEPNPEDPIYVSKTADSEQQPSTTETDAGTSIPTNNSSSIVGTIDMEEQAPAGILNTAGDAPTIASRISLSKSTTKYSIRARSSTLSIWSLNENEGDGKAKEVLLPAWMFLRLLPFYTDDNNIMDNKNESIAKNSKEFINRRPILPICLKRYSFDRENSQANRSLKRIIIPPVINLPQFVEDDSYDDMAGNFKLILESAICHRGKSISSGHFVAVVRKDKKDIDETDAAYDATWYIYDDMKKKSRVEEKSFKEIFSVEWPYMLFYRLVSSNESHRGYNSSISSSINNSLKQPKPFIVCEGSNNKIWVDSTLSPVISNEERSTEGESDEKEEGNSSIQNPEITTSIEVSLDESEVDIRNKYYWYITDMDRNYYKEYPDLSKVGTSESAVTISPQFRRNSQWSEKSSNYTQLLNESQYAPSVANELNYNKSLNSSHSSVSLFKKSHKPIKTNSNDKYNESAQVSKNSIATSKKSIELKQKNISNEKLKAKKTKVGEVGKKEKKQIKQERYHKHKLMKDKYKKEKCILM